MDRCKDVVVGSVKKTMDAAPLFGSVGRCQRSGQRLPKSPLAPESGTAKNSNVCPSSSKLQHNPEWRDKANKNMAIDRNMGGDGQECIDNE
jgi:hypothetical protein